MEAYQDQPAEPAPFRAWQEADAEPKLGEPFMRTDSPAPAAPTILYAIDAMNRGGAQIRSLQLIEAVKNLRPETRIIVYDFSNREDVLDEAFRAAGAELIKRDRRPRETIRFWQFCRQARPSVVHTNIGVLSGYLLLIAYLSGVKVRICHFRSTVDRHSRFFDTYLRRAIGRLLIWLFATKVVGVCHSVRKFSPVRDAQWLTIYNGIPHREVEVELQLAEDRPKAPAKVLALGRIHHQKSYWRFVPIFDAVRRLPGHEHTSLHIVGTGAPEDIAHLQSTIDASPFHTSIHVHGDTADPFGYFRSCDVLLLTSDFEGLPGTALEALSVGTPVVSADLPGAHEIAAHIPGVSILPHGASEAEWARAVDEALRTYDRLAIIRAFHSSPFLLGDYVASMMQVWGLERGAERHRRGRRWSG